jgi:DNA-binding PadR family transcriptional regulator
MHGYLLRQHAKEFSWIYPMTNASIYPALHALEQDGFISHEAEIHNGRARKVYQITEAGREELAGWLTQPQEAELSLRDQLVLKLSMQNEATIEHSKPWLQTTLAGLRAELDESDRKIREAEEEPKYTRLAREYGAEMLRLRVRYLEQVLTS